MIKAIVIDDVKIVRDAIVGLLTECASELITVIAEADSVKSGLIQINKHQPDVIFLDIEMKDGTGFDLLQQISIEKYKIVFITAYDHYAIKAFKYSAIDYLLKPIDPDELKTAVYKLKNAIEKEIIETKFNTLFLNLKSLNQSPEKIILKTTDSIYSINIKDIIRCESDNNYTRFYLVDGKKILTSVTLKEYEELFGGQKFFRIHQSHLINLLYFDYLKKQDGGLVVMKDKSCLPLASRKKDAFLKIIETTGIKL